MCSSDLSPIGQADSSVSGPVLKTLVDVATALQSGSLDGAKSAFSTLGQSINAAAQAAAVSPSTGAALSPQQLTTTLVSRILSQMNGSGSDPLIAAMGGGSSATTDPLLAALNGNDGKTGGDPLVAAMSSGVNIVV